MAFVLNTVDHIINVKRDWGAVGDQLADDTAAIQAAVDSVGSATANRGVIFFPPGIYKLTAPVTLNNPNISVVLLGTGSASKIYGNYGDWLIDRVGDAEVGLGEGIVVVENLRFENVHATGGLLRLQRCLGTAVRSCAFSGNRCIDMFNNQSWTVDSCTMVPGGQNAGSIGIEATENGVIKNCDIGGFQTGIMYDGPGLVVLGNRMEVNQTAIALGASSTDDHLGISAIAILGGSFEGNTTAIDFIQGTGQFLISGVGISGFETSSINWGPPQYGIRIREDKASNGMIIGCGVGGQYEIASISIASAGFRSQITFENVDASNASTLGGVPWILPANPWTARFVNCMDNNDGLSDPTAISPIYTFAGLPDGTGSPAPYEGEEYNISDSNTATFGATVAGGGANRVKVRYNGTNWTVVGA